jgi:hypothetical protein
MSVLQHVPNDLGALTDAALVDLLQRAEAEEHRVSRRRRRLHERIDNVQVRSGDTPEVAAELRAALELEERALSARRLALHEQIIDLRVERSHRVDHPSLDLRAFG